MTKQSSTNKKDFLDNMGIEPNRFDKLKRDINILIEIAQDYEKHRPDLMDEANYIANKLQRCEGVHTVRSRIKATDHLIEKIIRKWEEETVSDKYDRISKDNYKSVITDLIGVRAIYLFKNDWEIVHKHIISKWVPIEPVIIYHRTGDDLSKYQDFTGNQTKKCETKEHVKGYRSIHYIIPATKIDGQEISCEIQTRTIFEEGWSEIDHKVCYPSFSDDPYLKEYLNVFNRIAGSSDEMGSFVKSLSDLILKAERQEKIASEHSATLKQKQEEFELLLEQKDEDLRLAYQKLKDAGNNINSNVITTETDSVSKNSLAYLLGLTLVRSINSDGGRITN